MRRALRPLREQRIKGDRPQRAAVAVGHQHRLRDELLVVTMASASTSRAPGRASSTAKSRSGHSMLLVPLSLQPTTASPPARRSSASTRTQFPKARQRRRGGLQPADFGDATVIRKFGEVPDDLSVL